MDGETTTYLFKFSNQKLLGYAIKALISIQNYMCIHVTNETSFSSIINVNNNIINDREKKLFQQSHTRNSRFRLNLFYDGTIRQPKYRVF